MFRALATLAGTLETLSPRYPILEVTAEIGGDEMKERMTPTSMGEFVIQEWAELGPLLRRAPRHLDHIGRLAADGRLTGRIRLFAFPDEVRVLERLLNRVVLTLLTIGPRRHIGRFVDFRRRTRGRRHPLCCVEMMS